MRCEEFLYFCASFNKGWDELVMGRVGDGAMGRIGDGAKRRNG